MNYNDELEIKALVKNALKEDIGAKDITTDALIPAGKFVKAVFIAKEDCVVCGLGVAGLVFQVQDKNIKFKPLVSEGDLVKKGKTLAQISGNARGILTAERVALNFIGLLCGISTKTRKFVDAVKPYKTKILDTRKTIPGLRILQKYAVRLGGGFNHRFSLDEMVLIKDNHLKVSNGYQGLQGLGKVSNDYQVELEVKNLTEFKEALELKPDIIMLDNMSIKDMKRAVQLRDIFSPVPHQRAPKLEASGGITLRNVRKVACTGVDMISVGELTHSLNSADISLEIL